MTPAEILKGRKNSVNKGSAVKLGEMSTPVFNCARKNITEVFILGDVRGKTAPNSSVLSEACMGVAIAQGRAVRRRRGGMGRATTESNCMLRRGMSVGVRTPNAKCGVGVKVRRRRRSRKEDVCGWPLRQFEQGAGKPWGERAPFDRKIKKGGTRAIWRETRKKLLSTKTSKRKVREFSGGV